MYKYMYNTIFKHYKNYFIIVYVHDAYVSIIINAIYSNNNNNILFMITNKIVNKHIIYICRCTHIIYLSPIYRYIMNLRIKYMTV